MGNQCPSGEVLDAGLCYKQCRAGYTGVGPVCWGECPSKTTDAGATCAKKSYGRGAGTIPDKCTEDEEEYIKLCYKKCREGYKGQRVECLGICPRGFTDLFPEPYCAKPKPYGRGAGHSSKDACERSHDHGARENGCERYGLLWYPKCDPHFHNVGCCICSPDCPSGFRDTGEFCAKPSYVRGAGKVPKGCSGDKVNDAGLCYHPCREGYKGAGPVCWAECSGETTDAGAFCTKKSYGRGVGTIPKGIPDWLWWVIAIVIGIIVLVLLITVLRLFS
jgi:hypothetical protein